MDDALLREQLRAAQSQVAPQITTPAVGAVHERLRMRRQMRAAGAAVAVFIVVIAAGVPLLVRGATHAHLPAVLLSGSPTPSELVSAVPSRSPAEPVAGGASTARTHGGVSGKSSCVPKDYAQITSDADGTLTFNADVNGTYYLCPGQRLRVFWVQYQYQPDGSQTVLDDGEAALSPAHPIYRSGQPSIPNGVCAGDLYEIVGAYPVIAMIAPGQHDPYPSFVTGKGGQINSVYGQPCSAPSTGTTIGPDPSPSATDTDGSVLPSPQPSVS